MPAEAVIKVENVSKKFCKTTKNSMVYALADIGRNLMGLSSKPDVLRKSEFWAVDNVSFEVKRGETLGLIGPNGSGKTTLLKMLNGIFWPDKGKITIKGRVGALIAVGAGFHPLLTGRENIYVNAAILGMNRKEVDKKFDQIVEFADIGDFLDSPVKHYSSGMYVRLGFAIAVHCEPDILLVDEVLAVGDEGFQTKCFNKIGELKKKGVTTILVSHNMHAISTSANRVILIHNGLHHYFIDVNEATREYSKLFHKGEEECLEKICSGNKKINFYNVQIEKKPVYPGDNFSLILSYDSQEDYLDVEIDTTIRPNDVGSYFQATNKAYQKKIDIPKGKHSLKIEISSISYQNIPAKISISIWTRGRGDLLFWWRVPVNFQGKDFSTGLNFFEQNYNLIN